MRLAALRLPDSSGELIREPDQIASEVAKSWAPIFAAKPFDLGKAQAMIDKHSSQFSFHACHPPSIRSIAFVSLRAPDSKPGGDGIPYAGWAIAGHKAHETLYLVSVWLASGMCMPLGFNDSVTVFLPKGASENDLEEIVREPSELEKIR